VIALLAGLAAAAEVYVVRPGETLGSIAARFGGPELVPELRAINRLTGEPIPGTVLVLPPLAGGVDLPAALIWQAGEVTVRLPGGVRTPGALGLEFPAGTEVCTGPTGHAMVRLAADPQTGEHDDLRLQPDTCATVDGTSARAGRRTSHVRLARGAASLRPVAEGGSVVVSTPSGVTLGETGGFRVAVEEGAQRSEAVESPAQVYGAGRERALAPAQGTRTPTGKAPAEAVDLPSVAALVSPEDGLPLRRPEFSWTPGARAIAWRVEIAIDAEFAEVVYQEDLSAPSWTPEVLLLPRRVDGWWWRVASIDRTGFVGPPTPARRLLVPAGLAP
jgi:hypothetical protein